MKKVLVGLVVLMLGWTAWGADTRVAFPVGESRTQELSFVPDHFFVPVEGRNLVKVSLTGQRQVRFEALAVGQTVVQFLDGEEVRDTVTVTVTSGLAELRQSLKRRIDDSVSGASSVDVSEEGNKLVLDGTIRSPGDWEQVDRILRMSAYSGKVENQLSYAVDDATIAALKRKLGNMGFEVTDHYPQKIGQLQVVYKDKQLSVDGTVYSQADLERLKGVLESQGWIKGSVGSDGSRTPKTDLALNVGVDDESVMLTAAIMAVSKSAAREIGGDAPTIRTFYSIFYDFLTGRHGTDTMRIEANIGSTLNALARDGVTRQYEKGSMHFHLNRDAAPGQAPSKIRFGGTMKIQLQSKDDSGVPLISYDDVEYGFSVEKISAVRVSEDEIDLALKVEQRLVPYHRPDGSWDMQENVYNPHFRCKLGETVLVGGYEQMYENTNLPDGMPLLRHIPIVNWFVSKESHADGDKNMVMAICVEPVLPGQTAAAELPPVKDITVDINKTNAERIKESQRWHGCLAPLNWFTW